MATITKILCPVDLSETSRHAAEHAAAIARWSHAPITALYVYTPPFVPVPGLPWPEDRAGQSELARVREATAACLAAAGAERVDVVVDIGAPARHILDRAAALPADLIVMGTHGAGGFEHLLLGSVAEKVLRKAPCPVLTVPPRAHATSRLPFTQLLCAIDFSDSSMAGLDLAASWARESNAALTLLHVIEWPWVEPPAPNLDELPADRAEALAEYRRYLETSARHRLEDLTRNDAVGRVAPSVRVSHGKPYVEILRHAAELRADLIVIGVHGRNAADMMVFGSTANQTVRRASCPVLTLRTGSSEPQSA